MRDQPFTDADDLLDDLSNQLHHQATLLHERMIEAVLQQLHANGWSVVRFNPDAPEEEWHLLVDQEWTP